MIILLILKIIATMLSLYAMRRAIAELKDDLSLYKKSYKKSYVVEDIIVIITLVWITVCVWLI